MLVLLFSCKILLRLAHSLYVLYYKRNTLLTSTHDLLFTLVSYCYRHFTITQSNTYVCMSFDYTCRLLGCVTRWMSDLGMYV